MHVLAPAIFVAGTVLSLPAPAGVTHRSGHSPVAMEYNPDLKREQKRQSIASTVATMRDLGIQLVLEEQDIRGMVAASGGRISAKVVTDADSLYDTVYYLTDLARLPAAVYPLFPRVAIVADLQVESPLSGKLEPRPLGYEATTRTLLANHENFNQLDLFGHWMHPKANYAMLLEQAVEARLRALGPAALAELGLDILVDDEEWARLNGSAGMRAYNGENLTFVGLGTALQVTPPGMIIGLVRELSSGVPASAYPGLPDASQPWWSPRHSPALDRQATLRSLYSRSPEFYQRLGGLGGLKEDSILKEKTRLVLYGAFVASGGVFDHAYWTRRHPGNAVIRDLTRDFEPGFLARLQERLTRNEATRAVRLSPIASR